MPAAARLTDPDDSDGAIESDVASTVFINGLPAAMLGSLDRDHAPYGPPHPPHVPNPIVSASGTVFIEGRPAARKDDPFNCGHIVAAGSPDVNIGD
jgi:uncharacterized Zn-binding protein involved in type VI secretion